MFETLIGYFIIPGMIWAYFTLLSIIFIASVENDSYIAAVIIMIIGIVVYASQIVAILTSWKLTLIAIGIYAIVGGGWSVFRWFKYCKKYIQDNPTNTIPDYFFQEYKTLEFSEVHQKYYELQLAIINNKSQIMGWIIFWPWSLFWHVIGDFFTFIYDLLHNTYKKVADLAIKKSLNIKE